MIYHHILMKKEALISPILTMSKSITINKLSQIKYI